MLTRVWNSYRERYDFSYANYTFTAANSPHDNYATYQLLDHYNIEPFIALVKKSKSDRRYNECDITVDEKVTPYCKSGHKITYYGPDYNLFRHKWCSHVGLKNVKYPFFQRPQDHYGHTYYIDFKDDILFCY